MSLAFILPRGDFTLGLFVSFGLPILTLPGGLDESSFEAEATIQDESGWWLLYGVVNDLSRTLLLLLVSFVLFSILLVLAVLGGSTY
jgi:hypothetical protein